MSHETYFTVVLLTIILGAVRSEVISSSGSISLMSSPRKPCKIPYSKQHYYLSLKGNRLDPNESIDGCGKVAVNVKCFDPTRIIKPEDFAVCFDGQWYPSDHTCEQKKCPPIGLNDTSIHSIARYSCTTPGGVEVSCLSPAIPGTKLTIRCRHWRYLKFDVMVQEKLCLNSGEWEDFEKCELKCGLVNHNESSNNLSLKVLNEFPWHAVIYRYQDDKWNQLCLGSVLTSLVILTAFDCVTPDWYINVAGELKVAVGKYYKDYNTTEPSSRMYDVNKVFVSPTKTVVLLAIGEFIEFSDTVASVCFDETTEKLELNETFELFNLDEKFGQIVVWGKDEEGHIARVVETIPGDRINTTMELRDHRLFFSLPSKHKFVRQDIGSGLVTRGPDDRFYLLGILVGMHVYGRIPIFEEVLNGDNHRFILSSIQQYNKWMKENSKHWDPKRQK